MIDIEVATITRDELEKNFGHSVASQDNTLPYNYVEEYLMIDSKN